MTEARAATDVEATQALEALELALARRDETAIPGGYQSVLHDSVVEFGTSGRVWTRDEILEALNSGPRVDAVTIEKFDVHIVRPGVFLVMYETTQTDPVTGLSSRQRRSSLWMREGDGFVLRFHQSTPIAPGHGDPG
jgi:ribonuclease HI